MVTGDGSDGGGGSVADVVVAPVVLVFGEVDDGERRDEEDPVARRRSRWRPGTAVGGDRSCGGSGKLGSDRKSVV